MEQAPGLALAEQLLAALPETPDCYLQRLDLVRSRALLIRFDEGAYRTASFLDDRILTPDTQGAWLPLPRLLAAAQGVRTQLPLHYILHTGHVGSTLVSRLLDTTKHVLSLREPLPLRALADAHDALRIPDAAANAAQFAVLLEMLLKIWSRGYATTRCVVVKATSATARAAPLLLQGRPQSKAIYLNLQAEPYLATLLAGQNSPTDLRGHAAERTRRLSGYLDSPLSPLQTLSLGELAAASWLTETLTRRAVLAKFPDRVVAVDFDALLADLPREMQRIVGHFGVPVDDQWLERLPASPILARYSKAPDHPYSARLREEVLSQARFEHRDEIRRGLGWLENLARVESAVADVLKPGP